MKTAIVRSLLAGMSLAGLASAGCAARGTASPGAHEASLGLARQAESGSFDTKAIAGGKAVPNPAFTRAPWQFGQHAGHLICTPNYRIYTTLESEKVLDRLPAFYELALSNYTSALAPLPQPRVPLETFMFQDRRQWQIKAQEILPDQARMFANLGRGGITTRGTSVLYYIDRWGYTRDTFAIAAHEGWHQYTQQTFRHQLPIWLEEGIATYMEGYRTVEGALRFEPAANRERLETLAAAVRDNRLIPLEDLLTRTPQSFLNSSKSSLLVYYSQVWGLTRFLQEGEGGRYRSALTELLGDAAVGRLVGRMVARSAAGPRRSGVGVGPSVGPAVLQEYFSADLADFESRYLRFLEELARTGRATPAAGPKRQVKITVMRIGVLSDSHGRAGTTRRAVAALLERGAQALIHLGDLGSEAVIDELAGHDARIVLGNCDDDSPAATNYARALGLIVCHPLGWLSDAGQRIAFTHGHLPALMQQALEQGADYLLHGHTHHLRDERIGGTRVINPGALHRAPRYTAVVLDPARDELEVIEIQKG